MCDSAVNDGASTSSSFGEYEQSLSQFDELVQKYLDEKKKHLSEAALVNLEAELVKALCKTLNLRLAVRNGVRPKMNEWLGLIGLSQTNIRHIQLLGYHDILTLAQLPDNELKSLAERGRYSPDSKRRVQRSCEAIRFYLEYLQGRREGVTFNEKQLSWSVKIPPNLPRNASQRGASVESVSPLNSPRFLEASVDQRTGRDSPGSAELLLPSSSGSFPGSPSPSTPGHSRSASGSGSLSVLTGRTTLLPSSPLSTSTHSTPTLGINSRVSHSVSLQFDHMDSAQRSPQLSRINHTIPHKWYRSAKIRLNMTDQCCTVCQRPLGFSLISNWEKCRSCKFKVHTQCKNRIGDTCGLTPDHLRHWVERLITQSNTSIWNDRPTQDTVFPFPPPEPSHAIDSSSSTNSTAPSTPAALGVGPISSPYTHYTAPPTSSGQFIYPDTVQEAPGIPDIVLPESNGGSPETIRTERLESSEGTIIGDSTGSAGTDITLSDGSNGGRSPGHTWDRNRWTMNTIRGGNPQTGWKEVIINMNAIQFKKSPNPLLGHGRFGDVHRGFYYGDAAVKFLNMDHIEDEARRLDEFKNDVAAHKNTRHDNIVLFMGCFMEEGKFGIVTSFCKGQSLYRIIHETKERLDLSTAHQIAVQICQGISYLHTKKILHKDLRTKNIFIESKYKVVITDFGLASMKRILYPPRENSIQVSNHWLAYQAPEIIQSIAVDGRDLPYSEKSDAYSFGTIWYELLTFGFPFAKENTARIIYFIGSGQSFPLNNNRTNKECKHRILDIVAKCWKFHVDDRPVFSEITKELASMPLRRLDRSPSYPAMRSYESIF